MDIIDISSEKEAVMLAAQIQQASKIRNKLIPKGACHYCDEEVKEQSLFCNGDCSFDYEKEQKMRSIKGKEEY